MEGRKFWVSVSKDKAPPKFGANEHRPLLHDNLVTTKRSHTNIIQHIMCNKPLLSFWIPRNRSNFAEFMYLQARKYLVSSRVVPREHMPKVLRVILAFADSYNRYVYIPTCRELERVQKVGWEWWGGSGHLELRCSREPFHLQSLHRLRG